MPAIECVYTIRATVPTERGTAHRVWQHETQLVTVVRVYLKLVIPRSNVTAASTWASIKLIEDFGHLADSPSQSPFDTQRSIFEGPLRA
jgi:hypothetical protein